MRAKVVVAIVLMGFLAGAISGEDDPYTKVRDEVVKLYQAGKYQDAARILENNFDRFPDHTSAMGWNLAVVYLKLKSFDKGLAALKRVHRKGHWFNIWALDNPVLEPYRKLKGFSRLVDRNEEFRTKAQESAAPILKIIEPEGFDATKTYPLFIALHGGGGNLANFMPKWTSPMLKKSFIVAYLQSSQVVSMDGFSWEDKKTANREIFEAYQEVSGKYSLTDEVLIGGFSSGGMASLQLVMDDVLPVKGFVVLCLPVPQSLSDEQITAARDRGIRGTVITSELDRRIKEQRTMADRFKELGLQYQFIVTPNIGHWFPEDMGAKIDDAIDHIRNR